MPKSKSTEHRDAFIQLLKELRLGKNLTQKGLAERLGLPQSFVSKYETGERRLDFVETANVCEALGITIEQFSKLFMKKARNAVTATLSKPDCLQ